MRRAMWLGVRLLFGGAILFETTAPGCLAESLRDLSGNIDEFADNVDDDHHVDFDTVLNDIEDWFDD